MRVRVLVKEVRTWYLLIKLVDVFVLICNCNDLLRMNIYELNFVLKRIYFILSRKLLSLLNLSITKIFLSLKKFVPLKKRDKVYA